MQPRTINYLIWTGLMLGCASLGGAFAGDGFSRSDLRLAGAILVIILALAMVMRSATRPVQRVWLDGYRIGSQDTARRLRRERLTLVSPPTASDRAEAGEDRADIA